MEQFFQTIKNYTTNQNHAWYIYFLIVCVLCSGDVLTGVYNAWMNEDLQSYKFKRGAIGKTAIIGMLGLAMCLDFVFGINYLFISTSIFYILEESLSIIENLGKYIQIPDFVKEKITSLKEEK